MAGGVVLGRDSDGRVVLATGGIGGERVVVELEGSTKKVLRGPVVEVIESSPSRVDPPCGFVAAGCGGCDLQHVALERQPELRREVVLDALSHVGGFDRDEVAQIPIVSSTDPVPVGDRTTVRMGVDPAGALGFRRARSNELLRVGPCLTAHPLLQQVIDQGRFEGAKEVVLRASEHSGEVLAVVSDPRRGAARAQSRAQWSAPDGVRVVTTGDLRSGERVWITEQVAGRQLRVSAESFFQSGPRAAEALAATVARALPDRDLSRDRLVDLYGGVGLFTVMLGAANAELVERSKSSAADARENTAHLETRVTRTSVESWTPSRADVVVADPSRTGLRRQGVDAVAATGADRVVLVSCDAAAMARDLSLLGEVGYRLRGIELVDLFPHTHHVEAVSSLELVGSAARIL